MEDSRRIFLDLDGTLLDVSERYCRLHHDLVTRLGGRPLAPGEYWRRKRERVPEAEILAAAGLAPRAAAAAAAARRRQIESPRYLALDRPWPWTEEILARLAALGPLVLVTLRHEAARLERQLDALGLARFFAARVAAPGDGTLEAKAKLLRAAAIEAPAGSVFVGDTEVDVASGRALGLSTVALCCGLRSAARLAVAAPDHLLDDLRELPERLTLAGWG